MNYFIYFNNDKFDMLEYESNNNEIPKSNIVSEDTIYGSKEDVEKICEELNSSLVHDISELIEGKFIMFKCKTCNKYFKFTYNENKKRINTGNSHFIPNRCRKHRQFNKQISYRRVYKGA